MVSFLKKHEATVYSCIALLLAMTVKYLLANATVAQLNFLLWPPAKAIAFFFSAAYGWDPEKGYVFSELGMYINKGCAAINFLVILFLTLTTLVLFYSKGKKRLKGLLLVVILIYPITLLVNSFRIIVSVYLNVFTAPLSLSLRESLHEFTGGLCFFSALQLLVLLFEKIVRPNSRSISPIKPSL